MVFSSLVVAAVALAIAGVRATEYTAPFILYSTSDVELPSIPDDSAVSTVHHGLSRFLSSCPTKKYAVIIQPGVSNADYEDNDIPIIAHRGSTTSGIYARNIQGQVDVTAMVNTILMDCLHHNIKAVQSLDTSQLELPALNAETVAENVIYAPLPAIDTGLSLKERVAMVEAHDLYIEKIVWDLFDADDFTLVYITQARRSTAVEGEKHGLGSEAPLVLVD